ncbi:ABC transporter B family member 2 [Sorghum bicolor]|uniref:ABC transporter B family member 2 n=1 Tax=Sorghum bicolor TaxID=4558 RepID=UPI000B423E93|nr:ABC transporter B family member 2 [Sorghum bicolor]|eukprot:XP_002451810.2 ABC transporter B family member 2 [Sorghum bicolor]
MHSVLFLSWALLIWFTSVVVHKRISNGGESFTTMLNVVIAGLSLGQAAPNISTFLRARTAAYPIFQMIERSTVNKASSKIGRTLPAVDGHIQFRNVHFSYPSRPDVVILDRFSLDFPAGKIVAGSGSGKSTVVSLIERFYEPLSGSILLDGHDIKELDVKWLRRQIGLVNQEPALFATSIRENILYGKGDATMEEINHAAKLSEAITFINHLPDRYETQVGERGIQLSGGQNQRIAISRTRRYCSISAFVGFLDDTARRRDLRRRARRQDPRRRGFFFVFWSCKPPRQKPRCAETSTPCSMASRRVTSTP